jgi:hypothetical protein
VLGLPEQPERDGQSLLRVLKGEAAPREYAYIAREDDYAARSNAQKLIYRHGEAETPYKLFDLLDDPKELLNRYEAGNPASASIEEALHAFFPSPTEGWRLAIAAMESGSGVRALVDADSAFTLYLFNLENEINVMKHEEGEPPIVISSLNHLNDVVIRTAGTSARVQLELVSNSPFEVYRCDAFPETTQRFSTILDPAADALSEPSLPENSPLPVIGIWYERPALEQEAAPAPDAETREILEGFGYL